MQVAESHDPDATHVLSHKVLEEDWGGADEDRMELEDDEEEERELEEPREEDAGWDVTREVALPLDARELSRDTAPDEETASTVPAATHWPLSHV
jgi:hypothetical protein